MPMYNCPISMEPPRVPVITNEGTTYDFVPLALWLLRENTNHHPDFNPILDPKTRGAISVLIYNRATKELNDSLMDEVLPLSHEEKNEMASLSMQLTTRFPTLQIHGIHTLEGMQALIGAPITRPELAPDFVGQDGRTSLYIAASEGLVIVVRQLLTRNEVNPNQANINGATPLFIAAQEGQLPVVTALLADPRIDPNLARTDGTTPLFIAAQEGQLPVVTALLAAPRIDPNLAKTDGATPLFIAAQEGQLPVVTALLAAPRIDPNLTKTDGATPLLIAAQKGHLPVATALLADPRVNSNLAMTDGATPLYTAALFGHLNIVQALLRHQNINTRHPLLTTAAQNEYPAFVHALLSDETIRDYYLNQIILKPEPMRTAFTQNPIFFAELNRYRSELWVRLREPVHFNLPLDEYRALLRQILDSRQEQNRALHHPLYTLFEARWSIAGFFGMSTNILDGLRAHLDTMPPHEDRTYHPLQLN